MTLAWRTWRRISPGADSPFSRGRAKGKDIPLNPEVTPSHRDVRRALARPTDSS